MAGEIRIRYDSVADALYIKLRDGKIENSEEIAPGIIVDYSKDGEIIGIEIIEFSKKKINLNEIVTKGPEVLVIST